MSEEDVKKITDDIIKQRRLPYSIEIVDIQGDRITVENNFGSKIVYIKKGENYIREEE
jgi:hypothetical protein